MKNLFRTLGFVLIAAAVVYSFYFMWIQSQPEPDVYEIVYPSKRDFSNSVVATGTLEARLMVELKPKVTGVIDELKVKAGDMVRQGDIVATIRIIPDMSMLNQAQSSVENSKIVLAQIEKDAIRSQTLYESGVVSRAENEQMQNRLAEARESLDAALSQVAVITKGVSRRSGDANNTVVRSTMDGTILSVPVKMGRTVSGSSQFSEGTTIAKVGNLKDVIFSGYVDEMQVAKLQTGMTVNLMPGAIQDISIPAILEYISPEAILVNGTRKFEVKAAADIPEGIVVRSGYSVNASIEIDRVSQVLSVDEVCISFEDGIPYVYKLVSNEKDIKKQQWERIPVKLGLSDGLYIEVKEGIDMDMRLRGVKQ